MFKKILLICIIQLNLTNIISAADMSYQISVEKEESTISECNITISNKTKTIICSGPTNTETITLLNNNVISWKNYFTENTYFDAKIKNNDIILTGKNKGKDLNKTFEKQTLPWIQSPSLLLHDFILSDTKRIDFIMVTGPMLSNMQIIKESKETLSIHNKTYESIKTKMSPPGWLGKLWKANIWFDSKTGNMIKYSAPVGPPGSKKMVMTLL